MSRPGTTLASQKNAITTFVQSANEQVQTELTRIPQAVSNAPALQTALKSYKEWLDGIKQSVEKLTGEINNIDVGTGRLNQTALETATKAVDNALGDVRNQNEKPKDQDGNIPKFNKEKFTGEFKKQNRTGRKAPSVSALQTGMMMEVQTLRSSLILRNGENGVPLAAIDRGTKSVKLLSIEERDWHKINDFTFVLVEYQSPEGLKQGYVAAEYLKKVGEQANTPASNPPAAATQ